MPRLRQAESMAFFAFFIASTAAASWIHIAFDYDAVYELFLAKKLVWKSKRHVCTSVWANAKVAGPQSKSDPTMVLMAAGKLVISALGDFNTIKITRHWTKNNHSRHDSDRLKMPQLACNTGSGFEFGKYITW